MTIAVGAALVTWVTPILYTQMVVEGLMTTAQIGRAASVELLCAAAASAITGARFSTEGLRRKLLCATIIFTLANLVSGFVGYPMILVMRGICGACSSVFLWFLFNVFARSTRPTQLYGMFLVTEGVLGLIVASVTTGAILPMFGSQGGYIALAAFGAVSVAMCAAVPKSFAPLPHVKIGRNKPTARGALGLAVAFMSMGGLLTIWVFVPALALQQGLPAWVMATAVPVALICQVLGGFAATFTGHRFPIRPALLVTYFLLVCVAGIWIATTASMLFILLAGGLSFLWMFQVPITLSYLVDLDPTRRSVLFQTSCQQLGSASGPALGSLLVVGADVRHAILVGAAMLITALSLVVAETIYGRRRTKLHSPEAALLTIPAAQELQSVTTARSAN
ncbi:MFS transporter [Sphingobium sp. SA916]|uniref:MFS transporter n=1 Tax=Sphingobium sp. SA916 TaxID=1851207 RepID=UPI000C9F8754|nr:MFS transporter [Sphingobium sp. SA916]PNP94756.1 hypothetical protein A8G00_24020 [Sphingobium sp. SA916]